MQYTHIAIIAHYWEEIMTNSLNRRNFLRGSAVVGASTLAAPAIAGGHGTTLKMQAAWGGGFF